MPRFYPHIIRSKKILTGKDVRAYHHVGMVECERNELDIRVAPGNIDRVFCFMDGLLKD